jgi:hypothetical protein
MFQNHSKCSHYKWHRKETTRYFPKTSVFGLESSFHNCFWNPFITSGLSQICKIRNGWKLPISLSRITLIPSSEKTARILSGIEKRPQGIFRKPVSLVWSLVFKTVFGIFLSPLVCIVLYCIVLYFISKISSLGLVPVGTR